MRQIVGQKRPCVQGLLFWSTDGRGRRSILALIQSRLDGKSELWGLAGWKFYMVDKYYGQIGLSIKFYHTSNLQLDIMSQIQISNSTYIYRFYNLQQIWKGYFGLVWSLVRILGKIRIIWSYHTPSTRTRLWDRGCLIGEAVMTAQNFSQFSGWWEETCCTEAQRSTDISGI